MNASLKALGIDRLGIEERLALVEQIWDSIAVDSVAIPVTSTQAEELDRRLVDHQANPGDAISWDEVKSSLAKRSDR